jgi:hypothetical protein
MHEALGSIASTSKTKNKTKNPDSQCLHDEVQISSFKAPVI